MNFPRLTSLLTSLLRLLHPIRFVHQTRVGRWALLLVLSALLVWALEAVHLPAAFLLGPMLAGIVFENLGAKTRTQATSIRVPLLGVNLAQAVVGLLIARTITPEIVRTVIAQWPLFAGFTLATL
ncbi:AbrB family transcriptional regulator, partial [Leptospira sp. SA-E8]|uniref:AbrB family transcriptional regulator n=1 Tax=Leptospira sp. SA-E8 TaxID=3422259 RepID=UPI003EB71DEC